MKTPTTIIPDWSAFGRFFVNENCLYFGKKYKNLTGINSEPGVGFDWALENSSNSSDEEIVMEDLSVLKVKRKPGNPTSGDLNAGDRILMGWKLDTETFVTEAEFVSGPQSQWSSYIPVWVSGGVWVTD